MKYFEPRWFDEECPDNNKVNVRKDREIETAERQLRDS